MLPERIHKPGLQADTFIAREMIEQKFRAIKPDDVLGWVTGPGPLDFEFNPEIFPPLHRKVTYHREAAGSDWFVREGSGNG